MTVPYGVNRKLVFSQLCSSVDWRSNSKHFSPENAFILSTWNPTDEFKLFS